MPPGDCLGTPSSALAGKCFYLKGTVSFLPRETPLQKRQGRDRDDYCSCRGHSATPSTERLTTTFTSSSRESDTFPWPATALHTFQHINSKRNILIKFSFGGILFVFCCRCFIEKGFLCVDLTHFVVQADLPEIHLPPPLLSTGIKSLPIHIKLKNK